MPLDISVSRQYGDNTVTLRTNLPVTKSGPSPPSRSSPMDLGSAGASDLPADRPGGVARLVSTASFFGDEQQGGPRQRRGSYLSEEQGVASDEARPRPPCLGEASAAAARGPHPPPHPLQVIRLSAEIDRLKRKALSRGVNLTSKVRVRARVRVRVRVSPKP